MNAVASSNFAPMPRAETAAHGAAARLLLGLVLASYVFESPLRYALNLGHLQALLYLRDAGLALVVLGGLVSCALKGTLDAAAAVTAALVAHGIAGWLMVGSAMQALLGMKIFLPLLAGMAGHRYLLADGRPPPKLLAALWFGACGGVLLNQWVAMPWEGLSYEVLGHDVEANMTWYAGELSRLSGFARASYEAAAQILVLSIFLLVTLRSAGLRLLIWVAGLAAITLTTTKGVSMAYLAVGIVMLLPRRHLRPLLLAAGLLCVLVPVLSVAGLLSLSATLDDVLLGSFADRMRNTWPGALAILADGHVILGGGLGAIGVPLDIFQPQQPNPGDNLFVYMAVAFGVFALPYFGLLVAAGRRLAEPERAAALVVFACLVTGLTMSVIEGAFASLFLGGALGRAAFRSAAHSLKEPAHASCGIIDGR